MVHQGISSAWQGQLHYVSKFKLMFVPIPGEYFVKENDISTGFGDAVPQNRELLLRLTAMRPFAGDGTGNPLVDGGREHLT